MKADAALRRTVPAKSTAGLQYAALPWRVGAKGVEVLLVTSRRTRRWILPKGWPVEGLNPDGCAAMEALEEAGAIGDVEKTPLGVYRYTKHHKKSPSELCIVEVYALKVTQLRKTWPEKHERERRWCTIDEAALSVDELKLRLLLLEFGERMQVTAAR